MSNVEYAVPRLLLRRVQQTGNVEGFAFKSPTEAGSSYDIVQVNYQLETLFFREERVHIEDTKLLHWR